MVCKVEMILLPNKHAPLNGWDLLITSKETKKQVVSHSLQIDEGIRFDISYDSIQNFPRMYSVSLHSFPSFSPSHVLCDYCMERRKNSSR